MADGLRLLSALAIAQRRWGETAYLCPASWKQKAWADRGSRDMRRMTRVFSMGDGLGRGSPWKSGKGE
jgi:hypothetical protein